MKITLTYLENGKPVEVSGDVLSKREDHHYLEIDDSPYFGAPHKQYHSEGFKTLTVVVRVPNDAKGGG